MSTLPASGDFDVGNIADNDEAAGLFESLRSCIEEAPGGKAEQSITIASGSITPSAAFVVVDGEGAAADTLTNAVQTNHPAGRILVLRCADAARPITISHLATGAGEFHMIDGLAVVLKDADERIWFIRESNLWKEIGRTIQNRLGRVLEITEVAASPKVLVASDSGTYLKGDASAAATNYATLPAATVGLYFNFGTDSAQRLRLTANGTDTIQRRGTTSGAGGYYETAAEDGFQGSIRCWKSGQWIITHEEAAGSGAVT